MKETEGGEDGALDGFDAGSVGKHAFGSNLLVAQGCELAGVGIPDFASMDFLAVESDRGIAFAGPA